MSDEKPCIINPERDCLGLIRSKELEKDLGNVEKDLNDLRRQNSASHERMFDRLQALESQQSIQTEKFQFEQQKLAGATNEISEARKDIKSLTGQIDRVSHKVENQEELEGDIIELQGEYKTLYKDFMKMGFRVDALEHVAGEVDEIKEKPAKKWEDMTGKILWAVVAAIVALVLSKIGLA